MHSVLILMFGQSNADAHNAGPALTVPFLENPSVVVPNDGRGFQGLRGGQRLAPITGFVPSYNPKGKIQSIGAAMGCSFLEQNGDPEISRVIVRSAARGGAPFTSIREPDRIREGLYLEPDGRYSPTFECFLEDARQIVAAAEADGSPVRRVYIPFFHGEADRSMARGRYFIALTQMMDDIDGFFADLGIRSTWLLTQAAGTSDGATGGAWPNRLAVVDVAQERPNAHLVAVNYAYELEDKLHLNAESKALIGEAMARRALCIESGKSPRLSQVRDVEVFNNIITLRFDSPTGITIDTTRFDAPEKSALGFMVDGQPGQSVNSVRQLGPKKIEIACALPVSPTARLNYAYEKRTSIPGYESDRYFPLSRGCLREAWSDASRIVAGAEILSWLPAFSIPLSEPAAPVLPNQVDTIEQMVA